VITDEIRQLVEREIPDNPELRNDVLIAFSLDKNLMRLTDDPNRTAPEVMALKRIQKAYDQMNAPDES
jgi:hypothetical protein